MSGRHDRVELFSSTLNHTGKVAFYWSYVASNGRILSDGAQGYSKRIDALKGARRVTGLDLAPTCDFKQDIDGQERQVWVVSR